jgi:hypothetical protein
MLDAERRHLGADPARRLVGRPCIRRHREDGDAPTLGSA